MSDARNMVEAFERLVDGKIAKALRGGPSTVPAEYMGEDSEGKAWVVLVGSGSMTPVRRSSVEASVGDTVSVTVADGMAVIDANLSDKSAGMKSVAVAKETAVEAIDYASQANAAASSAQSSATSALRNAGIAQASADSAVADAARANEAAVQAVSDAADAADAADSAQDSANKATYALSDVEKVVGTVNWIAEHGEYLPTEDTAVDDSKVYYTRSGSGTQADPYTYSVVANPVDSELSTYFELHVDESIQNFINAHVWLTNDGLYVGTQGTDYKARIDADSLDILDDTGAVVATFGETAQIGKSGESHVELDFRSMSLVDKGGDSYFEVKDLRDASGYAEVSESFVGEGMTWMNFALTLPIDSPSGYQPTVTVDGSAVTYEIDENANTILLPQFTPSGSKIVVTYKTRSSLAKAATFGRRATGSDTGAMSIAVGDRVEASGPYSYAEGSQTKATGYYSHAEGRMTEAFTTSHAEGVGTKAINSATHAQNDHTIAASDSQTALGRYNVEDANGTYAVIVGNGTSDSARSDALTVDWSGNVECGTVNGVDVASIGTTATPVSATTSVDSGSNRNVASIQLAAGTWIVCAKVQFPSNATGRRAIKLSTSSQESGNVVSTNVQTAVSGATMQMSTSRCFTLASAGTVYLIGWQNSGSALSCVGDIEATRIC